MDPIRIQLIRIDDNDVLLHIYLRWDKCPEHELGNMKLEVGDSFIIYEPTGIQFRKVCHRA